MSIISESIWSNESKLICENESKLIWQSIWDVKLIQWVLSETVSVLMSDIYNSNFNLLWDND